MIRRPSCSVLHFQGLGHCLASTRHSINIYGVHEYVLISSFHVTCQSPVQLSLLNFCNSLQTHVYISLLSHLHLNIYTAFRLMHSIWLLNIIKYYYPPSVFHQTHILRQSHLIIIYTFTNVPPNTYIYACVYYIYRYTYNI